jgi:NRPS condensation-like uncharacterized protein
MQPDDVAQRAPSGAYPDLGGAFTPLYQRLQELGVASRVVHVGKIGPRGRSADFFVDDATAFLADLERSGRFCEDTAAGRILHRGKASWREDCKARGLHVAVDPDGRVLAHLDRYSPVAAARRRGYCRYSPSRVVVHTAARVASDLIRFVFGHRVDCAPLLLSLRRARLEPQACPHPEDPGMLGPAAETAPDGGASTSLAAAAPAPTPAEEGAPWDGPPSGRGTEAGPSPLRGAPHRIPFSALDEAVHALDDPAEPWSIHWEVRVSGHLDEARLRWAVGEATARHPMARARRARSRRRARTPEWEIGAAPDVDPVVVIDCPDSPALEARRASLLSRPVPLTASPPFRVGLAHHPDGDVVVLNVNHAATDSFGALRLLYSIARAYSGDPDPVVSHDVLTARDVVTSEARGDLRTRVARLGVLARKMGDLVAVPARLAREGATDRPGYGIHLERLGAETRHLALLDPATVNKVLVASLHLTVALWNIEHGVRCGRVSVLMPVNLRPEEWRRDVVANLSVLARTMTKPADRSLHKVLAAVGAQVGTMERERTLAALLELIGQESRLPPPVRRALPALLAITGNRLVDTAALAYLGRLDPPPSFGAEAGETVDVWYSPPARMPLGVSVGAVTVGDGLHLAFRYRHPLFAADAACRFADHYVSLLAHLLGAVSEAETVRV